MSRTDREGLASGVGSDVRCGVEGGMRVVVRGAVEPLLSRDFQPCESFVAEVVARMERQIDILVIDISETSGVLCRPGFAGYCGCEHAGCWSRISGKVSVRARSVGPEACVGEVLGGHVVVVRDVVPESVGGGRAAREWSGVLPGLASELDGVNHEECS